MAIKQSANSEPLMDEAEIEGWDDFVVGARAQIEAYDATPDFYPALSSEQVDKLRMAVNSQSTGAGKSQAWLTTVTQAATEVNRHIPMSVLASIYANSKSEEQATLFITLPTALRDSSVDELNDFIHFIKGYVHRINSAYGESVVTFGGFYEGSDEIALLFTNPEQVYLMYAVSRIAYNAVKDMGKYTNDRIHRILEARDKIRGIFTPKNGDDDPEKIRRAVSRELAKEEMKALLDTRKEFTGEQPNALNESMNKTIDLFAIGAKISVDDHLREVIEKEQHGGIKIETHGDNNTYYINLYQEPIQGYALPKPIENEDETPEGEEASKE